MTLSLVIILIFLVFFLVPLALVVKEEQKNMDNKHNAKYAFYYLLSLAALIFTGLSVGMIIFNIIDKTVADALLSYRNIGDGSLKFAISALFIAAPIYYVIAHLIGRGLKSGELDKESPLRRWLTYFILLVSSIIILGVFIGVINNFLSGELSARFSLKALATLIISGTVFSYYFYEAKRQTVGQKDKVITAFFWGSLVVVVAAFVAAWFFVESPQVARERRLDQAVINNIYSLENVVNEYYTKAGTLPDNFDQVKEKNIYLDDALMLDPETKQPIEYKKINDREFELCATFRLDSRQTEGNYPGYYPTDAKSHGAGYQCLSGNLYSAVQAVKAGL